MIGQFGRRMQERREALGWSRNKLAKLAKVSQGYLSDIENGRKGTPGGDVVKQIADCLGTSTDYLLGLTDVVDPTPREEPPILSIEEELAALERQFRKMGISEHDIKILLAVARRMAPSTKIDESPKGD